MIAALLPLLGTVLDKVIPDSNARKQAKEEMEKALVDNANAINLAVLEVNKAEAQHRSIWVAGWRPGIGWVCAAGFAWAFLGQPIAVWVTTMVDPSIALPEIKLDYLMEMTLGMLGVGGLRSWEKSRGLTK